MSDETNSRNPSFGFGLVFTYTGINTLEVNDLVALEYIFTPESINNAASVQCNAWIGMILMFDRFKIPIKRIEQDL